LSVAAIVFGVLMIAPVVAIRLLFLASSRLGWFVYGANVLSEFFVKKVGLNRFRVEAAAAFVGVLLLGAGIGVSAGFVAALSLVLLDFFVRRSERRMLTTAWTTTDQIGPLPTSADATRGLAKGYPTPSVHPELTINLAGPFVARLPHYRLGTLVVGRRIKVEILLGNHTIVPTQSAIRAKLSTTANIRLDGESEILIPVVSAGECRRVPVTWTAAEPGGRQALEIVVEWGNRERVFLLDVDRCITAETAVVADVSMTRYPGGCRSAFAWRGDMDLYDTSTLQSLEGLQVTLDLAARYRMPQTMYLSTRLALDEAAARSWGDHYGVDRGAGEIPRFVDWVRDRVELVHRASYPYESAKPYLLEIGNHGHLHYGTDTAAAAENNWKARAKIGAGTYPWVGEDRSSFGEQRDNAIEARRWCEELFGYTPKSWAMPDRTRDEHTARAMEAAGCEVLSDSDIRTIHNVLFQPPPHFPPGCGAVELTKRYPGDPEHIFHVFMNSFWMHRAHRLGIPVIFMSHQHMRQFEGTACSRFTEAVLRHALTGFNGDLWIDTVYGIGVYWRDVLSAEARKVRADLEDGRVFLVNGGELAFSSVPVDVRFAGGGVATYLVDAIAGSRVEVPIV
jgi:hypothetical protein